ncbi:MAG: DUF1501 domain-containing protein [Ilumatobacter sp.]
MRRSTIAASAGFAAPWALELNGIAHAAADPQGYRALVCVFLYGGNDHHDTFVPNDSAGYAAYRNARGGIARNRADLLDIRPTDGFSGAGTFGFAPELRRLHGLFERGDVAVLSNVGTLVRPLTKRDWENQADRPPQLFSHNDQQSYWQSSSPEGSTTGWGGRIADLLLDGNAANSAFTCTSVAGNAVMMSGRDALQYQVSPRGVTQLRSDTFRYDPMNAGIREIMQMSRPELFPASYSDISRRALDAADGLDAAVTAVDGRHDLARHFSLQSDNRTETQLSAQLHMVAKLIAAGRDQLGLKRQVFFVSIGGFDNHNGLAREHPALLRAIDSSLAGFHAASTSLGAADQVTTFTASDFGRTLTSNGDGTDHGWGGHHLVMGGAVRGNRVYGSVPVIAEDGPDDVGRGRLLPSTSVDQYAATIATWMGAGSSELSAVVPNIDNYAVQNLGFLTGSADATAGKPHGRGLAPAVRIGR